MKFVVTHNVLNEVDVRLAYETKEQIKKICVWTVAGAVTVGSLAVIANDTKKKSQSK
jgi:hypothetical protein